MLAAELQRTVVQGSTIMALLRKMSVWPLWLLLVTFTHSPARPLFTGCNSPYASRSVSLLAWQSYGKKPTTFGNLADVSNLSPADGTNSALSPATSGPQLISTVVCQPSPPLIAPPFGKGVLIQTTKVTNKGKLYR